MASIGSSVLPASSSLTLPVVLNIPILLANTEYPVVIPAGAKQYTLKARGQTLLKIATSVGLSGTTYFSLPPFTDYSIDNLIGSSTITLYVQSLNPSQVIEIKYWT